MKASKKTQKGKIKKLLRDRKVKVMKRLWPWYIFKIPFPRANIKMMIIAFGNTIYSSQENIPYDLIVHETTHCKQQKDNTKVAIKWWIKYIFSSKFRYSQELEAYQSQVKYLFRFITDEKKQQVVIIDFANILASKTYKKMVTLDKAIVDLKKGVC